MNKMNTRPIIKLTLVALIAAGVSVGQHGYAQRTEDAHPANLTCEYLNNPLGIDVPSPRLSWQMPTPRSASGLKQEAYRIIVATSPDKLKSGDADLWDSGKVESDQSVLVPYGGEPLLSGMDCYWAVKLWTVASGETPWSQPARFSIGLLDKDDWKGPWIKHPGTIPSTISSKIGLEKHLYFRRNMEIDENLSKAFIHVASAGYHELYVNGEKVDDRVLAPALTRLDKRVHYVTYDIAEALKPGRNTLAIQYGPGWSRYSFYRKNVALFPAIRVQLNAITSSGKPIALSSGKDWRCSVAASENIGKTRYRDNGGELIDGRRIVANWNQPGFDDSSWVTSEEIPFDVLLSAQMMEPSRIIERIKGKTVEKRGDDYMVDLGKNFTGFLKVRLRDQAEGDEIQMYLADADDGNQEYGQVSRYLCAGQDEEVFQNRFNYTAGRYVTLKGMKQAPKPGDVEGLAVSTDMRRTGSFECSNELFNRIYETDIWTFLANTTEGFTSDCPHRERLGYGEVQVATSWGIGFPNFQSSAFYTKVVRDWADVQEDSGWFNHTAPQINKHYGGPMWSSAGLSVANTVYKNNGDLRILESIYPAGKRWLAFLEKHVEDGLLKNYAGHKGKFLGDWAAPKGRKEWGNTPEAAFFNNCVYAMNLNDMERMARLLGREEDSKQYHSKLEELRKAIHAKYYDAEKSSYANDTQVQIAFALSTGVVPEPLREKVEQRLVQRLKEQGYFDMGSSGLPVLLKYLIDESDLAGLMFAPLAKTTQPGYGFFLQKGETTWPEYWSGDVDSRIHTCYTGIASWFIKSIGGIRPSSDAPGYKQFIIKPVLAGDLTYAKAATESLYGRISSEWNKSNGNLNLNIEIPANSSATVYVPTIAPESITMNGSPVRKTGAVTLVRVESNHAVFNVGSGSFRFVSKISK